MLNWIVFTIVQYIQAVLNSMRQQKLIYDGGNKAMGWAFVYYSFDAIAKVMLVLNVTSWQQIAARALIVGITQVLGMKTRMLFDNRIAWNDHEKGKD